MGTAADLFGSVPYTGALIPQPTFDSQSAVFAHVQAVLDSAIKDLDGSGAGTTGIDFFYDNDFAKWKAAAHTLKARFYMHTAQDERDGVRSGDPHEGGRAGRLRHRLVAVRRSAGQPWDHRQLAGRQLQLDLLQGGDFQPSEVHIALIKAAAEDPLLPVSTSRIRSGSSPARFPDLGALARQPVDVHRGPEHDDRDRDVRGEPDAPRGSPLSSGRRSPRRRAICNGYRASVGAPSLGAARRESRCSRRSCVRSSSTRS